MSRQREKYVRPKITEEMPPLLDCPQCHSFIGADSVNTQKHIAKCTHCDHVFNYETESHWDPFGPPLETQPDGIEILRLQSLLELRIKHRQSTDKIGTIFTLGFSVLWNLLLMPFVFFILSSGQWMLLLFISLHLFAGVSMLWRVLSQLFNTSTIEVNRDRLSIETLPFAWLGNRSKDIPVNQVKQLFVSRSKAKNSKAGPSYSLHVLLKSGKRVLLLSGLDRKTLMYLEAQIEHYMQIEDYPVG